MDAEHEKMIEVFTEWLNRWHTENDADGIQLTREEYDLYDDPPRVLADNELQGQEIRIITLYAHPYHDEGGPNFLTGFFSWDDGFRYERDDEEPHWILDALVQYFDTDYNMIFRGGNYDPASLPQGKEVDAG